MYISYCAGRIRVFLHIQGNFEKSNLFNKFSNYSIYINKTFLRNFSITIFILIRFIDINERAPKNINLQIDG